MSLLIFKQKNRIKSKFHFNSLFKSSFKVNCNGFIGFQSKSLDKQAKYAFVASKKVGNAVKRNKAKRIMRELVRLNQDKLDPLSDIVFVAKSSFFEFNHLEIEANFKKKFLYDNKKNL